MYFVYLFSAAWLGAFHVVTTRSFPRPLQQDLIWIVLMAIGPGIAGHGMFNAAIRHLKAYVVNAALLGEPVLATILAYFFFGEKPDLYYFLGAALVLTGLMMILLRQRNPVMDGTADAE
jgi:drug/metabolite transporter (DMT)-like permease